MTTDLSRLDVPLDELLRRIAHDKFARRMRPLAELLAHPELAATAPHATDGEAAELRHLLYDADADATVPAFPYPTAQEASS
jgi:hypothetical protein